jgi:CBS domain containing-hemolysin-like protein
VGFLDTKVNFSSNELILFGLAILVLLGMNAVFVATEFSLMKMRFTRFGTGKMDELKESKPVADLLENMSSSLKILRLGITLSTIVLGILFVPLVYAGLASQDWFGGHPLGMAIVFGIVFSVSIGFVFCELIPRSIAMQAPIRTLQFTVPFVRIFQFIAQPLSNLFNGVSRMVLKGFRLDADSDLNLIDVESQIRSIVSNGDELPEVTESILNNVMDLRKRVAHDIMIPRNQLKFFDVEDSPDENLKVARETGHTRFPVCEGDLDQCVGIVHIKDVFRIGKSSEEIDLNEVKRPIARFSMDEPLESVLQGFLKQKQHFALLIDEFGGTVGAVTLEDVLEELVGEIQDEFDRDREMISKLSEDSYLVDGLTPLHDVSQEIGVELESEEVSTFGGFITVKLGRLPRLNEVFTIGNLEITAGSMDDKRVIAASINVLERRDSAEEGNPGVDDRPSDSDLEA